MISNIHTAYRAIFISSVVLYRKGAQTGGLKFDILDN